MAVAYLRNALGGTTTTTSFSITLPVTAAGDLIIIEFTHRGTGNGSWGGTYSGPAFQQKHEQTFGSSYTGQSWWSIATGNHSGQTVTVSSLTNSCAAICTVYSGADATDPLGDAVIVGEANASGNETQAQISTNTDGAWVVLMVANSPDYSISSQRCTSPGTLTERAERLSTGGTDSAISHASLEKATAGATGAFLWSQTNAASGSWAYAIKPASTGMPQELSGAVDAVSAVSGAAHIEKPLAGAIAATSGATGNLRVIHPQLLAGVAPAVSAVAGAAVAGKLLGGSCAGQSTVAGAVLKPASMAGSVPALATASGTLSPAVAARLAGIIAAQAQAAGAVAVGKPLAGSVPAAAVLAGDLLCEKLLAGSAPALSGVAGAAQQDIRLAGLAAAEALVTGDLKVGAAAELEGIVAAASGVTGSLWVAHFLAGQAGGQGTLAGALEVLRDLGGLVGGTSGLTGTLGVGKPLSGQAVSVALAAGRLLETPPPVIEGDSLVTEMVASESATTPLLAAESLVTRAATGDSLVTLEVSGASLVR